MNGVTFQIMVYGLCRMIAFWIYFFESIGKEGRFRGNATLELSFSTCELCPRGRGTLVGESGFVECPACAAGRYQDGDLDRGVCNECPVGSFRSSNSSDGCLPCPVQSFADVKGLDSCKACLNGTTQPYTGQTECLCEKGAYLDKEISECVSCDGFLPGSTSVFLGARSTDECVCPAGRFWHRTSEDSEAFCKPCSVGLICHGGRELIGSTWRQAGNRWLKKEWLAGVQMVLENS